MLACRLCEGQLSPDVMHLLIYDQTMAAWSVWSGQSRPLRSERCGGWAFLAVILTVLPSFLVPCSGCVTSVKVPFVPESPNKQILAKMTAV